MRVRYKNNPEITGWAERLNTSALDEVLLNFDDGDATSEYFRELEVLLQKPLPTSDHVAGEWVPLSVALSTHDVVSDNYNTRIFEPSTEEDRARGFAL